MINFDEAISIIRRNGGFKPNRKDTSYYRTYTVEGNRPLQARISNHGTWLCRDRGQVPVTLQIHDSCQCGSREPSPSYQYD